MPLKPSSATLSFNTYQCGGRAQNCCCTFRKPIVETALPILMAVGAVVFLAVGIAYELWKTTRSK